MPTEGNPDWLTPADVAYTDLPDGTTLVSYPGGEFTITAEAQMQLASSLHPDETRQVFDTWFDEVMAPLDVDRAAAWDLFTGKTAFDEFGSDWDEERVDDFVERFPALSAAYHAKHDTDAG